MSLKDIFIFIAFSCQVFGTVIKKSDAIPQDDLVANNPDYSEVDETKNYQFETPKKVSDFISNDYNDFDKRDPTIEKRQDKSDIRKVKKDSEKEPKVWDHWGKWSECTVTCGMGKVTRWRHCVSGGCATGEKEAQIKTCTNPAC